MQTVAVVSIYWGLLYFEEAQEADGGGNES